MSQSEAPSVPCVVVAARGQLDIASPQAVLASIVRTVNEALDVLEGVLAKHGAKLACPRVSAEAHRSLPLVMVTAISATTEAVRDAVTAEAAVLAREAARRRRENGRIIALPPGAAR